MQYVAPPTFNIINSMLFLCAVVLGGQGNKLGVIFGAFIIVYLPNRLLGVHVLGINLGDLKYLFFGLALVVLVFLRNLIHSRVGRALHAIHDGETAANAMGINTAAYKLKVFVLSALLAAVAGVFFTHYTTGIGPSEAGALKSVRYVALAAAGGMANLWGAMAMGILLNFMSLRGMFGSYDDAVFGGILNLIMLFAQQGIMSLRLKGILWAKKPLTGK